MTMRTLIMDDQAALDQAGADLVAGWLAERPDALVVPADRVIRASLLRDRPQATLLADRAAWPAAVAAPSVAR